MLEVRSTHHGPIVNEALGADEGEPLALRWLTLDEPPSSQGCTTSTIWPPARSWSDTWRATPRPPRT